MSSLDKMFARQSVDRHFMTTVLVLSKLKMINATAPQPQRIVLKYFVLFKNVAHSLEPGEMPSNSSSLEASLFISLHAG